MAQPGLEMGKKTKPGGKNKKCKVTKNGGKQIENP